MENKKNYNKIDEQEMAVIKNLFALGFNETEIEMLLMASLKSVIDEKLAEENKTFYS